MTKPIPRDELCAGLVAALGKPNADGGWKGKSGSVARFYHSFVGDHWMILFSRGSDFQLYETVEAFLAAAADHFDITPPRKKAMTMQAYDEMKAELVAVLGEPCDSGGMSMQWADPSDRWLLFVWRDDEGDWEITFSTTNPDNPIRPATVEELLDHMQRVILPSGEPIPLLITPTWLTLRGWVACESHYVLPLWRGRGELRYYPGPDNAVAVHKSPAEFIELPLVVKHRHRLLLIANAMSGGMAGT